MNAWVFRSRCLGVLVASIGVLTLGLLCGPARAADVTVAVAANFVPTFQKIASDFAADTGHRVIVVPGSTGKLQAQIRAGAPYEVLLAADAETPRQLELQGWAVAGQRFTYATGRLVLWSARPGLVDERGDVLRQNSFAHLAVANPAVAPYGAATVATLRALGVYDKVASRLVLGDSVAQTLQFIASGNAELGFVSLSQLVQPGKAPTGSWWIVPAGLHEPLAQDAALLKKGEKNPAAAALLQYLKGAKAKTTMLAHGYLL